MGNLCHNQNVDAFQASPNWVGSVCGGDVHGFVTPEDLADRLVSASQGPKGTKGKTATINVDFIETILLHEQEARTSAGLPRFEEKGAAFITSQSVEDAVRTCNVRFEQGTAPGNKGRMPKRRGTGFITKEELLDLIEANTEDDEEANSVPKAVVLPKRSQREDKRRNTPFVKESTLVKMLALVGETENEE
mmetsp:Transcript_14121/g.29560  ORF Transcript_14121/g.29560 Transcript_14121/m.29560 type:complete len:191 (+) Transcript_14121:106-678(+)